MLALPDGFSAAGGLRTFREPISELSIKVLEDETWDCIGHADVALAASGTVTIEAAILGTPMVTFYRVMPLTLVCGASTSKGPVFFDGEPDRESPGCSGADSKRDDAGAFSDAAGELLSTAEALLSACERTWPP